MAEPKAKPDKLHLDSGDFMEAAIDRISGESVHFYNLETGDLESLQLSQLTDESRQEVIEWYLGEITAKGELVLSIKYDSSRELEPGRQVGSYQIELENNSSMTLPADIQLVTTAFRIGFELKNSDDQKQYDISSFNQKSPKTKSGPVKPKAKLEASTSKQISTSPPYNWVRLSGTPFRIPKGESVPEKIYLTAIEAELKYKGQVLTSKISPARTASIIQERRKQTTGIVLPPEPKAETKPENKSADTPATAAQDDVPKISYDAIAIIEGDDGVGSGFLLEMKERKFLVTNSHVITGAIRLSAKTTRGTEITLPRYFFVAKDRDLAIFPINFDGDFLEPLTEYSEVDIGEAVTVFGNERGASVVTQLTGKVNGVGPARVEIDAPFVEGNSGSPVVHHDSGCVIGLATYYIEYEKPEADTDPKEYVSGKKKQKERRRFAERIDNVTEWDKVSLHMLQQEAEKLNSYEDFLEGVITIANGVANGNRIVRPSSSTREVNYMLEDYHRRRERGEVGSGGENRALEQLKRSVISGLEARHREVERDIRSYYLKQELEYYQQLNEVLMDYVSGLHYY
ncbi:S1 family peptidase [Cerasicoccus maritimus]|uniref:S1 family peptidase n=1 Tax=Cerasicoccus maritimus TaxID=490089 RepID=UPI002852D362|nr:serine protease [Cerasicoccus maritimus]